MTKPETAPLPPYVIPGQWVDPELIDHRGRIHPFNPGTATHICHDGIEMIFPDQKAAAAWKEKHAKS